MTHRLNSKLAIVAAMILLISFPSLSVAKYPTKPVKVIVPWAAGGSTDILARSMLTVMDKYFPQPMVVINKPGGGGTVGTTQLLMSKPDGYTIGIIAFGPFVTQPHLKDLKYTENDYIVICQVSSIPRILIAHPSTPYNNIKEMIEYAKKNPGKVKAGVSAVGSTGYLAMVQLEMEHDVKFNIIPQGGGGPQKVAVLGGHIDVAPTTAGEGGPLVTAKQVKALCVMDNKRFTDIPDIPTGEELGVPIESGVIWHAYAPKGTPPDRVKILHDAIKNCLEDKTFQKIAKKLNLGIEYMDPEASKKRLDKFRTLYGEIIGKLGLKKK
ncbi:MAG: tripartite tricarboxylate transporter substrate binding protein [Deltaproteobacteria bacterium]|nr:tripartite tricarboxylate transporter substrate binding protein [Deltaproteobacteria bacterium]